MHKKSTNQLGQLKDVDIFMVVKQNIKDMRRNMKNSEVEIGTM